MKILLKEQENEYLYEDDIFGMARVGMVNDKYEVYVNTNDSGNIPHFHFRNAVDWNEFHICIRIDKAEYFLHDGKTDILNSRMKRNLQKFMCSKVGNRRYSDRFKNNWELVCFLWEINNSNYELDDDVKQPNYLELQSN